ncbi:divalent metal cation transporter [Paraburkholderia sp. CNPSo 3076]|uniref:NRAMP family divalent metal transporter n=1 Tax=Paraburkholderia sp. CNPSo 3076 TaxID=2940936 RepID=UPI00224D0673|nr:divalent metal cation transporter [Paraburkholderia sp. CNPSo 3076]MCX5544341.1 divalent metal cation transporter [Paraburkholderia sp. CNPSo 3076]
MKAGLSLRFRREHANRSELPAHAWAADIGPGLGTVATDNDPGGILTYSLAGAQYGFDLLWVCVLSYPSMVALQLIATRVAAVTGKGLTENMREHYARYANVLKWLALSLFAYAGVMFVTDVPWRVVAWHALVPGFTWSEDYFGMLLAVLGTTVSPYLLFSQAEQEVEERTRAGESCERRHEDPPQLKKMRRDTLVRTLFSNACGALILVAAAVTLHAAHQPVSSTQAAALAIAPIARGYASPVLGLALLGTALLALPPLAGSAAHAAASSFGWPQGARRDRRIAGVLVVLMVVSAAIALLFHVSGVDPVKACYWSALANGMTVAPVLILLLLLSRRREAVGEMKARAITRALCWLATLATGAALAVHTVLQFT